ncbi:hypothetical protein SEA_XIMENITA_47 [Mycobacterium phage Ximenita]|uniref:Uncharacterized protein n=1 Tax=Mycobacterium phage Ximenita TaxID=2708633 RepID=A0A6G6XSX9_9CAUD|nr:hypothetical protein I5G82_gp060 [Mycobacterium phage Ximenita]QIG61556.1 hypothetical protein SEA_XIMENITA_47 [Mycobacterium phage Ximenita]
MRVMAEVDREPVEDSVRKWRSAGRHYAKQAQELVLAIDDEADDLDEESRARRLVDVTTLAALASMYFAMAADVDCFGKLPPAADPADEQ